MMEVLKRMWRRRNSKKYDPHFLGGDFYNLAITKLTKKLKELEKSFSDNQKNNSIIIFEEAKKMILDSSQIKIDETRMELFIEMKNILQTLYF